jgi:hypothetical protein
MKKIQNKSYLQTYYGSDQAAPRPVRIVLNKSGPPEAKERKSRKGLYALGSN